MKVSLRVLVMLMRVCQTGLAKVWYCTSHEVSLPVGAQLRAMEFSVTWETTTNFNVGLEFSLFKSRLRGSFDLYTKKTTDMLFWVNIPESFGATGIYRNIGDIRNTGFELTLSGDIIRNKNFNWNVTMNMANNTTKILSLPPTKTQVNGGFSQSENNIQCWYEEGKSLYNAFIPEFAGIYTEDTYTMTGDATYDASKAGMALYWMDTNLVETDEDGNTSMNTSKPGQAHDKATTDWNMASYYEQGSILPSITGGFSTSVRIYDFDIAASFDYQLGGKIYDHRYSNLMSPVASAGNGQTYHKDVFDSWSASNMGSDIPRFQYYDKYTASTSDRFLTNASYLNFQSFTVGYTLPKSLTQKINISKVRVYVQGENLYFWSKRKGLDPRFNFLATNQYGVNAYSPCRTVMGGIQVQF